MSRAANVAVLVIKASTPPIKIRLPAATSSAGIKYRHQSHYEERCHRGEAYLASLIQRSSTVANIMSSSSSGEYPSPKTFTSMPFFKVPLKTRPNALKD